ncbi:MAG: hypothetical protein ACKO9Q_01670 [Pirellula sp.]
MSRSAFLLLWGGAVQRIEIDLWPKELQGLRASAAAIKPTLDTVMKRVG